MRLDGNHVGVVGGSIAGLAASVALPRLGARVSPFERGRTTFTFNRPQGTRHTRPSDLETR
jgi:hypothetical protein